MSQFKKGHRQSADKIQKKIIAEIVKLGWSVEVDHDDIIIGRYYKNFHWNFWIELKSSSPYRKDGFLHDNALRVSQFRLLATYKGDFCVAWNLSQVLDWCTLNRAKSTDLNRLEVLTPMIFQKHFKRLLSPKKIKLLRTESWWCLD